MRGLVASTSTHGVSPVRVWPCPQENSSTCLRVVLACCGGLNLRALELDFFQGNQQKAKVSAVFFIAPLPARGRRIARGQQLYGYASA